MVSLKHTLILALLLLAGYRTQAQVSTQRVRELVNIVANKVEEDNTDQVLIIVIDYVTRDGSATQTYYLSADNRYRVVAIGDNSRIKDLDLYVLNEYGSEVGRDSDERNVATFSFRPSSSGSYKFKVKPYKMTEGVKDGFFGLVVSRIRD